ncbi:hypothetical protein EVAR_21726_1 [Eumeta japonica]|uniref:Uncharacterized protein n=1 Tax=Eumeta variegata TaxID=151549 RepID=A0A4C1W6P3_EUMVA|nr:hypothetical protein EVAR_21726_1 [Eumeta japonica]
MKLSKSHVVININVLELVARRCRVEGRRPFVASPVARLALGASSRPSVAGRLALTEGGRKFQGKHSIGIVAAMSVPVRELRL